MPLPTLLAANTTVTPPRRRAVSPVAGKVAKLGLDMAQQEQLNWCWSAMAVSVRKFLDGEAVTQCEQANEQLRRVNCCADPASCNVPFSLDRSVFAQAGGVASLDLIKRQIDLGRPVGVQILWSDGGSAHFLCIDGYNIAGAVPLLNIEDPIYGTSTVPYDTLVSSYQSDGHWSASFLT